MKLEAVCSPCAAKVCAADPFCCNNQWDFYCLSGPNGAWNLCPELGCPKCAHDLCSAGAPLDPGLCDPCVAQICAPDKDPFCCANTWDSVCVEEVSSICGLPACN